MQPEQRTRTEVVAADPVEPVAHAPETHEPGEEHIHLAPQSMWPVSAAAGTALAGAGLVTATAVTILGVIVMFISIYYWVQELRHELH
jgi:hypothetical protein